MSEDKLKEAERMIREAELKKQKDCKMEIEVILQKYNYVLQVTPPQIIFVKREKPNEPS